MKRTRKLTVALISALLICATLATAVSGYYYYGGKYYESREAYNKGESYITDDWVDGIYVDGNGDTVTSSWYTTSDGDRYYFNAAGRPIERAGYYGYYGYYRPYYDYYYDYYYPYYYDGYYYNGRYYPYYGPYWDNPNLDPFGQFPDDLTNDGTPEVVTPQATTNTANNAPKDNPSMGGGM